MQIGQELEYIFIFDDFVVRNRWTGNIVLMERYNRQIERYEVCPKSSWTAFEINLPVDGFA